MHRNVFDCFSTLLWPGPGRRITDIIAKKISYIGSGLTCDWSEF